MKIERYIENIIAATKEILEKLSGKSFGFRFMYGSRKKTYYTPTIQVLLHHVNIEILNMLMEIFDENSIKYKQKGKTITIKKYLFNEIFKKYIVKGTNRQGEITFPQATTVRKNKKRKAEVLKKEEQIDNFPNKKIKIIFSSSEKKDSLPDNDNPKGIYSEKNEVEETKESLSFNNISQITDSVVQEMVKENFSGDVAYFQFTTTYPAIFEIKDIEEVHFSTNMLEENASSIRYDGEVISFSALEETTISSLTEDDIEQWIQRNTSYHPQF